MITPIIDVAAAKLAAEPQRHRRASALCIGHANFLHFTCMGMVKRATNLRRWPDGPKNLRLPSRALTNAQSGGKYSARRGCCGACNSTASMSPYDCPSTVGSNACFVGQSSQKINGQFWSTCGRQLPAVAAPLPPAPLARTLLALRRMKGSSCQQG